jgi:predicted metal-dependent hydrolase
MQNSENIVRYREIGEVRYVRSFRAKNLSIRINQKGEVRLTVPKHVSLKKAEAFLHSKKRWVATKLEELQVHSEQTVILKEGVMLNVKGRSFKIVRRKGEASVEEAIWRILRDEGSKYLSGRTRELAERHGYRITGVKVRKMKTRWGSCTTRNSINLNSWLVMLPEDLSDYVILHELVHTRHRNHSRQFWEELDSLTGGMSKTLRKELRSKRIMGF